MQNHPLSHQNKDGECGIYTIYFIIYFFLDIPWKFYEMIGCHQDYNYDYNE